MTLMNDLVEKTRSMIAGSFTDELSVLDEAYVAASGTIVLRYPKPSLHLGSLLSVGVDTFYVLNKSSDGRTITVLAGADGGPDYDALAGTVVRIKPRHTTWSIFREISDEIVAMSSPYTGLFQAISYELAPNWTWNAYPLPDEWQEDPVQPQELLRVRYQKRGFDSWRDLNQQLVEWQAERWQVQILGATPDASTLEFTFAFPFREPTSLADDVFGLGLTEKTSHDIPCLGAASALMLTGESRRMQPLAQGDSRRPEEVPITGSSSVSREFRREYNMRVVEERSRLMTLFAPVQSMGY